MLHLRSKRDSISLVEFDETRREYIKLLGQKELYWKQRAKQHWLAEGDANTRFFHTMATVRQNKNLIQPNVVVDNDDI